MTHKFSLKNTYIVTKKLYYNFLQFLHFPLSIYISQKIYKKIKNNYFNKKIF